MKQIEQTISSVEVAEMVGKEHSKLLRDIRNYIAQLAEAKIGLGDFFTESTYKDANNQSRPCFNVTKKGCEFIAHKLTGTKGTEFTARYINRFHEMENVIRDGIPEEKSKKEYKQLEIRFDGLRRMLTKWDEGTLAFEPTCPRSTYNAQLKAMTDYMAVLEARAVMEDVDLMI